jgi:nucleoside-diphosphate kinase
MERTLVILKPDAVEQHLEPAIITALDALGLQCTGLRRAELAPELVRAHYAHLADKPFFPRIVEFMTRGACLIMVYEGRDAVAKVRRLAGATDPREADPQSLRGLYGRVTDDGNMENVIHASATPDEAATEIARFFP